MIKTIWNFFFDPDEIDWRGVRMARTMYLIVAILTFGHIGGQHSSVDRIMLGCPKERPDIEWCYGVRKGNDSLSTALRGAFGGAFWPLYWSWHLQDSMSSEAEK